MTSIARPRPAPPVPPRSEGTPVWVFLLIGFLTLAAYLPALTGGFLWDDEGHVTRAELRTLAGLGRIWFEVGATQQYYPLLHSAFWLEHQLWGDAALGYHLVNVLLHAGSACLLIRLLNGLQLPGAWLAGLLFALHPVCVESVAWVSEQKNTLSTFLYLAAALAYLRFDASRKIGNHALATALFLGALLSKSVTATLPAALLVVFWWRGGFTWRRAVLPLVPWFALAVSVGLLTVRFERQLIGARGSEFDLGLGERLIIAGRAVVFYLGKLVWPAELSFIYPRWRVDAADVTQWIWVLAVVGALGALVLLTWKKRLGRGPLAAALLFGGTLFPALGFFNVYPFLFSFVADHFQYLASLSVFAAAGAFLSTHGVSWCVRLLGAGAGRGAAGFAAGALVLTLAGLTWVQTQTYRSVFTLYEATLARNPDAWLAHNNLALALTEAGRANEAIPHFEEVLRLKPGYAIAESNLGDALTRVGRVAEAVPHLEQAIRTQPGFAQAHNNLGIALMALGRADEAMEHYRKALEIQPRLPAAERNLGLALAMAGRTEAALPHFRRSIEVDPDFADGHVSLALALTLTGKFVEAEPHYRRALELAPHSTSARLTYGRALASVGRRQEALAQFDAVLALAPNDPDARRERDRLGKRLKD